MMKKLIAGNWKMNGSFESARSLVAGINRAAVAEPSVFDRADILVCPPAPYIAFVMDMIAQAQNEIMIGGQDCAACEEGAYTGDVAASMLADTGCRYVILGHSERRQYHGESDELIAQKAALAHKYNLRPIICVGETQEQRESGQQEDIVAAQLEASIPAGAEAGNLVIAYEPVWAIGTGKTATPDDVAAMHGFIRGKLQEKLADSDKILILYGGSVKPDNAKTLLHIPDVGGALIGGASLKADDFMAIARAA